MKLKSKHNETDKKVEKKETPRGESKKAAVLDALRSVKLPNGGCEKKPRVIIGNDNMFEIPVVYVYGPLELYTDIREKLFGPDKVEFGDAKGYCTFGRMTIGEEGACVAVVWANWRYTPEQAMPIIVHELSHAADDIMAHACIKDEGGEVKAYFIEAEFAYFLEKMYGIKMPRKPTELVKELLHDIQHE